MDKVGVFLGKKRLFGISGGWQEKQLSTLKVEPDSLEKRRDFVDAVATPFDGFDFVVEPLNEATGYPMVEVVENVLPVALQGFDEFIIARDWAQPDLMTPRADSLFCPRTAVRAIENSG